MLTNQNLFNFQNSYLTLPEKFYSLVTPKKVTTPELVIFNQQLAEDLELETSDRDKILEILSGNLVSENTQTFAQAYAGHQFGYFTNLGDGRAIFLGEHLINNQRFDIQLKGSGKTPYSRRGDGKATLKAMLREYLISEAMFNLGVPSSRSLAVIKSNDLVYREFPEQGAILTRVMKSHLRVGTFEFAKNFTTINETKSLLIYTINRLFPEFKNEKNQAILLLEKVMNLQIDLVINWLRVGFIHGVMNTDNTSISGETFDYGPCAFMNTYNEQTVFSSIDSEGRYAFGNQGKITKWNIARFAESLLSVIDENFDKSVEIAQSILDTFDEIWNKKYYQMMLSKIGKSSSLVDDLLKILQSDSLDYTNTFNYLLSDFSLDDTFKSTAQLKSWKLNWKNHLIDNQIDDIEYKSLMRKSNPVFIPRNHQVEYVLEQATFHHSNHFLIEYLEVLKNPYIYHKNNHSFLFPPKVDFEYQYKTFCGT